MIDVLQRVLKRWREDDNDPRANGSGPILVAVAICFVVFMVGEVFGRQYVTIAIGVAAILFLIVALVHRSRQQK